MAQLPPNPYASGLLVAGTGPNGSSTNWTTQWDPATGTYAANSGFGLAPIYTADQFSQLMGKLPGNESFGGGAPNPLTYNPDASKGSGPNLAGTVNAARPSAGENLIINTGQPGGAVSPGMQDVSYMLDPKTGYYVPSSASGTAPFKQDILDTLVPGAILGTAAAGLGIGAAGALGAGGGAAAGEAAGGVSSIADPTAGFIASAEPAGQIAGGIDIASAAPLAEAGAASLPAATFGLDQAGNSSLINDIANAAAGSTAPQLAADNAAAAAAGDAGITADIGAGGSSLGDTLQSLGQNKSLVNAIGKLLGGALGGGQGIGGGNVGGIGSAGSVGYTGAGGNVGYVPGYSPIQAQSQNMNPALVTALREMLGQGNRSYG